MEAKPHLSLDMLPGRWAPRLAAAVLGSLALYTAVLAQKPAEAAGGPAHAAMIGKCGLSFFNPTADSLPPPTHCEQFDIPKTCLPNQSARNEVKQIHYSSKFDQEGRQTAWQVLDPTRVSSRTRNYTERKDLTGQDDGGILKGAGQMAKGKMFTLALAGVNRYRMIVSQEDFNNRKTRRQFGRAAMLAHKCGMDVDVTFSCKRDGYWTKKAFGNFTGQVARYFMKAKRFVSRFGICNEPFHPAWNPEMKNKSTAQTTCTLYFASQPAIKRVNKKAEIQIGELSPNTAGGVTPLQGLRDIATACKKPIKVNYVAIHPYTWQYLPNWNNPRATIADPTINEKSDTADATALNAYGEEVQKLHDEGYLSTPSGGVPKININEFGVFSEGTSSRVVSLLTKAMMIARIGCAAESDDRISGTGYYNWFSLAGSTWQTGVVNSYNVIEPGYATMREIALNADKCATPAR